jgi:hypothetical protein
MLVVILLPAAGMAAPLPQCGPGTLQDYIDQGSTGCFIGDKSFFDFVTLSIPGAATPIDSASVQVTPVDNLYRPELHFALNANAAAGQFLDIRFGYSVQVLPTGSPINGLGVRLTGASATGDAAVTAIEDVCLGEAFALDICGATPFTLIAPATEGFSQSESTTFAPLLTLGVINDIGVDGGLSGAAGLVSAVNDFSEVPEPAAFLLVSAGLLCVWRLRRPHHP